MNNNQDILVIKSLELLTLLPCLKYGYVTSSREE